MKFKSDKVQKVYETICIGSFVVGFVSALFTSDNMSTGEFLFSMSCLAITFITGFIIGKCSR